MAPRPGCVLLARSVALARNGAAWRWRYGWVYPLRMRLQPVSPATQTACALRTPQPRPSDPILECQMCISSLGFAFPGHATSPAPVFLMTIVATTRVTRALCSALSLPFFMQAFHASFTIVRFRGMMDDVQILDTMREFLQPPRAEPRIGA